MAQAESCPRCGTREEDWVDAEGKPHSPPLFEPIAKRCEGCAERTRFHMRFEEEVRATYGTDEAALNQIKSAMSGYFVVLVPFDPYRDVEARRR